MEENRKKRFPLTENVAPKKLKLLITVVNKNKAEFYMDYLQEFEINMQMSMRPRRCGDWRKSLKPSATGKALPTPCRFPVWRARRFISF